jgi:large subunit ribosomal protein L18
MADKNIEKAKRSERRRRRVRGRIFGTPEKPRLSVSKSLRNIHAQIIDDENGITLAAASSSSKSVEPELKGKMTKTQVAAIVGRVVAGLAKDKGVMRVVLDRGVSKYHGRVKAVAEGAREGGLKL